MKIKGVAIVLSVLLVVAVVFLYMRSQKVQIIVNTAEMQKCHDTGIFEELSGKKTKEWNFGIGDMIDTGSVVCIYDGFGKPTVSRIEKGENEAKIYVRTDSQNMDQHTLEVIVPGVHTIDVFDAETNESYAPFEYKHMPKHTP